MNEVHFKNWQKKFYRSKEWKQLREEVIKRDMNICQRCGKLILGKAECEVDHIKEITPQNCRNLDIILNVNNLQCLCHNCHTFKTNLDKNALNHNLSDGFNVDYGKRDKFTEV